MRTITQEQIKALIDEAAQSPRKRTIYRLHEHHEPVQRMVNALVPGTYITPHKHENPDKVELMSILRGKVAMLQFTDTGDIAEFHILDEYGPVKIVDIPPRTYHSMVALQPSAVLEIIQGPYDPATHKQFADFAPQEGEESARLYLRQLESKLRRLRGFFRTNATHLSDDELILLDVLFDSGASRQKALRRELFAEMFNTLFAHGLFDDELEATLADMLDHGYLKLIPGDRFGPFYEITPNGLAIWEKEREPDWGIYCSAYSDFALDDHISNIACVDLDVAKAFLDGMVASGLYPEATKIIEVIEHQSVNDFVPGKHFDRLYEVRYSLGANPDPIYPIKGHLYRKMQSWWRTTDELMNLKHKAIKNEQDEE